MQIVCDRSLGSEGRYLTAEQILDLPNEPNHGAFLPGLLYPGSVALLNGVGGVGKSTLLYSLCAAALRGEAWLGRQFARPLRVLFIDAESTLGLVQEKMREAGIGRGDAFFMPETLTLLLKYDRMWVQDHFYRLHCDLLVLDGLRRIDRLEREADNAQATRQMNFLSYLAKCNNACVLCSWHVGNRGLRHAVYAGRGASARAAEADVLLLLDSLTENVVRLRTVKNRFTLADHLDVQLKRAGGGNFQLLPKAQQVPTESAECAGFLREWLQAETKRRDIIAAAKDVGFSQRTVDRAMVILVIEQAWTRTKFGYFAPHASPQAPDDSSDSS